jgi:hypothetical protein
MQNIEPRGLNISCTCKEPPEDSGGGLGPGRERRIHDLKALEHSIHERDWFSR